MTKLPLCLTLAFVASACTSTTNERSTTSAGPSSAGSSSAGATSSAGSGTAAATTTTGGTASGASTGSGTTGSFAGPATAVIAVESVTVFAPGADGGAAQGVIDARFLASADLPPCTLDAGGCCFFPAALPAGNLDDGALTFTFNQDDGGASAVAIAFDGGYPVAAFQTDDGLHSCDLTTSGGQALRSFEIQGFASATPVLTPDLGQLV